LGVCGFYEGKAKEEIKASSQEVNQVLQAWVSAYGLAL
jgi:HAMP domain-containing protein